MFYLPLWEIKVFKMGKTSIIICNILLLVFTLCSFTVLASCHSEYGDEKQLKESVDSFSTAFLNWRFVDALRFCTSESRQWLSYMASNIRQADIEALHCMSEGVSFDVDEINYSSDSTANVSVNVRNYMSMDTIGKSSHIVNDGRMVFGLVFRGSKWSIHLTAVPRLYRHD